MRLRVGSLRILYLWKLPIGVNVSVCAVLCVCVVLATCPGCNLPAQRQLGQAPAPRTTTFRDGVVENGWMEG